MTSKSKSSSANATAMMEVPASKIAETINSNPRVQAAFLKAAEKALLAKQQAKIANV